VGPMAGWTDAENLALTGIQSPYRPAEGLLSLTQDILAFGHRKLGASETQFCNVSGCNFKPWI
jgi:hypothetical protein